LLYSRPEHPKPKKGLFRISVIVSNDPDSKVSLLPGFFFQNTRFTLEEVEGVDSVEYEDGFSICNECML